MDFDVQDGDMYRRNNEAFRREKRTEIVWLTAEIKRLLLIMLTKGISVSNINLDFNIAAKRPLLLNHIVAPAAKYAERWAEKELEKLTGISKSRKEKQYK